MKIQIYRTKKSNSHKTKTAVCICIWISALIPGLLSPGLFGASAKDSKMSLEHSEFLSKVRYIISGDENKFFKNLPDDKRDDFIDQFWAVRDPNPATPENEFKEEYFKRIDESNRQFTAGREGWLTDRGKTYILLGTPNYVQNVDMDSFMPNRYSQKPYIMWHYDDYVIPFVDQNLDGDYKVEYYNLDNLADVQDAFQKARKYLSHIEGLFSYEFKYKKINGIPTIIFMFDLKKITFKSEGEKVEASLEISVTLKDSKFGDVWEAQKSHVINFSKIVDKIPDVIKIEIPMSKDIKKGNYFCFTSVKKVEEKDKSFLNKMIKVK
jgi:GWxTD domain-containing protein